MERSGLRLLSIVIGVTVYGVFLCPSSCRIFYNSSSQCRITATRPDSPVQYHSDGDVIIGGLFNLRWGQPETLTFRKQASRISCRNPSLKDYLELRIFVLTVREINEDKELLPNVTLGYKLHDNCRDLIQTVHNIITMLSGDEMEAPNYSCMKEGEVAAFVGEDGMAELLDMYGYVMISYDTDDRLSQKHEGHKAFFNVAPNDLLRFPAISSCLKHFGWNWVGVITSDEESTKIELQELRKELDSNEICIAYVLNSDRNRNSESVNVIEKSKGRVIIVFGKLSSTQLFLAGLDDVLRNITLILHESWIYSFHQRTDCQLSLNCSLMFMPGHKQYSTQVLSNLKRYELSSDIVLQDLLYLLLLQNNISKGFNIKYLTSKLFLKMPEREKFAFLYKLYSEISNMNFPSHFSVYTAVYSLAYALHDMQRYSKSTTNRYKTKAPQSRCSERCPPGYRKVTVNKYPVCCYECVPCSEGEISNVTDSDKCHRCPDTEWPNEKTVKCIPKTLEYLSHEDTLALIFSVFSLASCVITVITLKVFISFWDTPVVKANNRTVSFILLTSILLSFLCVFLFLGLPVDITCMLRQVSFGIFFTIAVSSVLAKTITVCIAFKATKPGCYWRKWMGSKLSNYVVTICSSVQVLICTIWLSVSPPYQENDMSSSPGIIIIQCNEGSVIGFYSVLGYMGLLAGVSLVLAFMVRTLPDSFNEAKYITFSMLVFCSVWIAMIPAYVSTRGKYMVAVEVFAILASSAGLLCCIFLPKIYIILIKPEINSKELFLK
ncbi:vomeronasal type-2 receptor 26-like [Hyperolius riggenbachi]|uniref:vomeronasal type-2 receptor 26-like n=1 Tax=Hyperolius riggenbachi TaxID=752182 RepID=UPI0035A35694